MYGEAHAKGVHPKALCRLLGPKKRFFGSISDRPTPTDAAKLKIIIIQQCEYKHGVGSVCKAAKAGRPTEILSGIRPVALMLITNVNGFFALPASVSFWKHFMK